MRVEDPDDFFTSLPVQYAGVKRKRRSLNFVDPAEKQRLKLETMQAQLTKAQCNIDRQVVKLNEQKRSKVNDLDIDPRYHSA